MRVRYSTTLDDALLEKLKIRAIKEKKRINDLLEEAIKDYLKKPLKNFFRKIPEKGVELKCSAYSALGNLMWFFTGYILTIEYHRAFRRFQDTCHQIEKGGFPCPVRADQAHYFTFINIHVELVNSRQSAKVFGQSSSFKKHELSFSPLYVPDTMSLPARAN